MIEMNEATDFLDEQAVVDELPTIKMDSHLGKAAQNTSSFPGKGRCISSGSRGAGGGTPAQVKGGSLAQQA